MPSRSCWHRLLRTCIRRSQQPEEDIKTLTSVPVFLIELELDIELNDIDIELELYDFHLPWPSTPTLDSTHSSRRTPDL